MNSTLRILVIEDNPADVDLIRETLSEKGPVSFQIESVSRLSEAIARLESKGIDLVLIDLGLPDSQGLDTFHRLQEAAPRVPMVVLTGNTDEEVALAAVRGSAQDYLVKGQTGGGLLARSVCYAMERKRAEEARRESEARFRSLVENMSSAVSMYEVIEGGKDFVFKGFNKAGEQMERIRREDVMGRRVTEVFPGVRDFGLLNVFERVWKTGVSERFPVALYRDKRIEGWRDNFIYKLPSGEVVAVVDDVTDQKKAEEALRASEKKWRSLFETMGEGVFYQRADGTLIDVNHAALQMFGVSREEFLSRTSMHSEWDVIREDGTPLPGPEHPSMVALTTGKPFRGFIVGVLNPQTKTYTWVSTSAVPEFHEGNSAPYQVAVTMHDITERKRAEETLRRNQAMLMRTESVAHVGSWEWDVATDTAIWSDELFRIFQRDPADGAPSFVEHSKFYYPEDMQRLRDAVEVAVSHGTPYELEMRAIRKDGATRVCLARGHAEMGPGGKAARLFGSLQDITDRKRAEDALRDSEARYRALFDTGADGILIADIETKIFTQANPAICRMLGYTEEELETMGVADITPKEDLQWVMAEFEAHASKEEALTHDVPCLMKDGAIVYADINSAKVTIGGRACTVGLFRDITERKQAEEDVRKAREFLDRIINAIADPVFVKDDQRRFVLVNDALCAIVGRPRKGLLGEDGDDMFPKDQVAVFRKMDAGVLDTGEENANEESLSDLSSGEVHTIVTRKTRYIDPAGKRFLVGVIRDFTESKRAEKALRDSEEKYRLLIDNAQFPVVVVSATDARVLFINEHASRMFGVPAPQAVGLRASKFWCRKKDLHQYITLTRREGIVKNFEVELRSESGVKMTVILSSNLIDFAGQKADFTVFQDITERKQAEALLQESRAKYEAIFEATGTATLLVEEDATIVAANRECLLVTGYSPEELVGTKWPHYVAPESLEIMLKHHNARREEPGKAPRKYEVNLVNKKGEIRNVVLDIGMIPGTRRSVVSMLDITERKRVETALRESEEKYHSLTEATPDIIWQLGLDLRFIYVNSAIQQVQGYAAEELVGRSIGDFFEADHLCQVQEIIAREMQNIEKHTGVVFETEMIHKDGRAIPLEIHGMIQKDASGKPTGFQGVTRDITERKRAEEALKASEEKFSKAFASSSSMVVLSAKADGRIVDANESFVRTLGFSRAEVVGRTSLDLGLFADPADRGKLVEEIDAKGALRNREVRLRAKDGAILIGLMSADTLDIGGEQCMVVTINDITERKRAEEALRESRELLDTVLNAMPVRVFWKDMNLAYLGCNAPFARDAGFEKPEDLIGKDDHAMGWREQAELYEADDRAVIESGEPKPLFEEQQTTPSGERIHLLTSKLPLRDAGGAIVGVLGTYYDITKFKRVEEELKHVLSSARCILWHAAVTEKVGGGIDWDLRISNEEAAEALLPQAREPGQSYSDVWHSGTPREDLDQMDRTSEQAIRAGKPGYTQEFPCRTLSGEIRWLSEDARVQPLGPGRWLVIGVCTDVTSRREAEEKTKQQMEELRRWHNVTIGREERVAQLKREVNELAARVGEKPKYGGK